MVRQREREKSQIPPIVLVNSLFQSTFDRPDETQEKVVCLLVVVFASFLFYLSLLFFLLKSSSLLMSVAEGREQIEWQ